MGIPTLISTSTASNSSSIDITSGIDSTYDEYMFVLTDIGPATDQVDFEFQLNVDGQSGFNETMTTTYINFYHNEDDGQGGGYDTGQDLAQATGGVTLANEIGNGADESCAGILHLFSPASTTYVKHFYSHFQTTNFDDGGNDNFGAGYCNVTGAIDEITFKMSSGNFDGVIQMYGIS